MEEIVRQNGMRGAVACGSRGRSRLLCARSSRGILQCDVEKQSYDGRYAHNELNLPGSFSLRLCSGADARHADNLI
jgi:hypothetical protein